MAGRPTDALWGIGARTARKRAASGITSVGQLARADPVDLAGRFGPTVGPWYRAVGCVPAAPRSARSPTWRARAAGKPPSNATSPSGPNSTSSWSSWPAGSRKDVAAEGRRALRVGVKVRFAPFFTRTRSLTLPPNDQRRGRHGVGAGAAGPVRTRAPGAAAGSAGRHRPGEVSAGSGDHDHRMGCAIAVGLKAGGRRARRPIGPRGQVAERVRTRRQLDRHRIRVTVVDPAAIALVITIRRWTSARVRWAGCRARRRRRWW
jgi:hypothetical protein